MKSCWDECKTETVVSEFLSLPVTLTVIFLFAKWVVHLHHQLLTMTTWLMIAKQTEGFKIIGKFFLILLLSRLDPESFDVASFIFELSACFLMLSLVTSSAVSWVISWGCATSLSCFCTEKKSLEGISFLTLTSGGLSNHLFAAFYMTDLEENCLMWYH